MSNLFRLRKPQNAAWLTLNEVLALIENLQLKFDGDFHDEEEFQAAYEAYVAQPVNTLDAEPVLFVDEAAIFGFGFGVDEDDYLVHLQTPVALIDWEMALKFMAALAQKLGIDEILYGDEDERERMSLSELLSRDWTEDILLGLETMRGMFQNEDMNVCMLLALSREVVFDRALIEQIFAAPDPVRAFEAIVKKAAVPEGQILRPTFLRKEKDDAARTLIGAYILSDGAAVLPRYSTMVPLYQYDFKAQDVEWRIFFFDFETENFLWVPYDAFMDALPQSEWEMIDAGFCLVQPLGFEKIKHIAESAGIVLRPLE